MANPLDRFEACDLLGSTHLRTQSERKGRKQSRAIAGSEEAWCWAWRTRRSEADETSVLRILVNFGRIVQS